MSTPSQRHLPNQPPDPHPRRPAHPVPEASWDCHIHLFGPARDFAVDVTTARPGVTASLPPTTAPGANPGTPMTAPDVPQ